MVNKNNEICEIIEELCKLYQQYLAELDECEGVSFFSNDRVQELINKIKLKKRK